MSCAQCWFLTDVVHAYWIDQRIGRWSSERYPELAEHEALDHPVWLEVLDSELRDASFDVRMSGLFRIVTAECLAWDVASVDLRRPGRVAGSKAIMQPMSAERCASDNSPLVTTTKSMSLR